MVWVYIHRCLEVEETKVQKVGTFDILAHVAYVSRFKAIFWVFGAACKTREIEEDRQEKIMSDTKIHRQIVRYRDDKIVR